MKNLSISVLIAFCLTAAAEQTDSIRLANATLYYYSEGEGEPIILLSGGPGIASHQMDDLGAILAKDHRVIYFDQRGTGKSWTQPLDSTTINLQTAVDDIEILRKHLHLETLRLVGHSWGGMLLAAYTAHYPERVKQAIIIGGGELTNEHTAAVDYNIDVRFQLGDTVSYYYWTDSVNAMRNPDSAGYELRKLRWLPLIFDRSMIDAVMAQAEHGAINWTTHRLMWQSLMKPRAQNWIDAIRQHYTGRALILFGWQDPIGLTTLSEYQQAFPHAVTKGINMCGHMPSVEQPDIFYETILEFLKAQ